MKYISELVAAAAAAGKIKLAVAAAQEVSVLEAVVDAWKAGIAEPILVGDPEAIAAVAREANGGHGLDISGFEILPVKDLYAAAATTYLYSLPLFSSKIVKSLPLNEKLEKLVQHGKDWFKVRHLASGAEGWAAARDLKDAPVTAEPPKPKRKFRKKPAPKKPPQPEEAPLEPEAM